MCSYQKHKFTYERVSITHNKATVTTRLTCKCVLSIPAKTWAKFRNPYVVRTVSVRI